MEYVLHVNLRWTVSSKADQDNLVTLPCCHRPRRHGQVTIGDPMPCTGPTFKSNPYNGCCVKGGKNTEH